MRVDAYADWITEVVLLTEVLVQEKSQKSQKMPITTGVRVQ